ncbi:iron ABC transporter permease [Oligoflexia bacterium]|nr:iron ABC transporter permease [Oligoflexia bacterium]
MAKRKTIVILVVIAAAVLTLLITPFIGTTAISPRSIFGGYASESAQQIFWHIRVPRICFAFLCGMALAAGGVVFQSLFRNALATPFTLGVSSGAAFGVAVYYHLGLSISLAGISGNAIFALIGALLTVVCVYIISNYSAGLTVMGMLLAGIVINFFFSSLVLFMQYISDFTGVFRLTRWLMGGFDIIGFESVWSIIPFVAIGLFTIFYYAREFDLFTLGDDLAKSRGMDVATVKAVTFGATSLMIGGVVAFCGPIGFVGIIVPHICRLLIGNSHRMLIPCSIFFGGAFLAVCDTIARIIIAPYEIPVGVITSLLGGPFFLWLLVIQPKIRKKS